MKTQRNMKTRRWLFSRIALSLLVGIIGALGWSGGTSAQTTSVVSTLQIPTKGTVIEPDGTVLSISGFVTVDSTMVTDATLKYPPAVVLTFDFSNVMASDAITGTGAFKTGGDHDIKIRPLQATDTIPITCPYFLTKSGVLSADTWLVTTTLNFDTSTGKLASGSATVGSNPYLVSTSVL